MKIVKDYITESNGKYTVHGHTGKTFGSYSSKGEAEKRLEQIEYFKNAKDSLTSEDMEPGEMETLRKLFGKFLGEEAKEPEHQTNDEHSKAYAAGVVFITNSGEVLLIKRSETEENFGGFWGLPGGKAEAGETPEEAARRETLEEIGYKITGVVEPINTTQTPNGFEFVTYRVCVEKFNPTLDLNEHTNWGWFYPQQIPEKIHPGVKDTLEMMKYKGTQDRFALDKDSTRSLDDSGRMHVSEAHISKACINPYHGHEIPNWQMMGLLPNNIYYMYRDPDELKKAVSTFNGIQVLIKHIPVSADDPQKDEVVGTTGTNASFDSPYLNNELIIWSKDGISAIESGSQKELSCGYAYDPVMKAGSFNGERYDGIMTNIKGNHVALVSKGRAGPDVVVGDADTVSTPQEIKMKLTYTGSMVKAALSAGLLPLMALDSQLKFSTALSTGLKDINRKNFKTSKKTIAKMAKDAAGPEMTEAAKKAGASPDDVIMRVLDMVDKQVEEVPEEDGAEEQDGEPKEKATNEWRKGIMDKLMKDHSMNEDDAGAVCDMFPEKKGVTEGEEKGEDSEEKKEGEDSEEKEDGEDEEGSASTKERDEEEAMKKKEAEKKTMDSAIKQAEANTMKTLKAIRQAERDVQPLVGSVDVAMDSAEGIYREALKSQGVDTNGVHESALPALVKMAVDKKNAVTSAVGRNQPIIAQDAKTLDDVKAFDAAIGARPIRNLGA